MDTQAGGSTDTTVAGENGLPTVLDFLADLLAATVVTRKGKKNTLQWHKEQTPGRIEYQAKIRAGGRAIYVAVGTDQELNTPVVRVQVRQPGQRRDRSRMDKVLDTYDLDVTADTETRERFNILRQAIASQVATYERQRRASARDKQTVEMRAQVSADTAGVMERYFASEDDEETEE